MGRKIPTLMRRWMSIIAAGSTGLGKVLPSGDKYITDVSNRQHFKSLDKIKTSRSMMRLFILNTLINIDLSQ